MMVYCIMFYLFLTVINSILTCKSALGFNCNVGLQFNISVSNNYPFALIVQVHCRPICKSSTTVGMR